MHIENPLMPFFYKPRREEKHPTQARQYTFRAGSPSPPGGGARGGGGGGGGAGGAGCKSEDTNRFIQSPVIRFTFFSFHPIHNFHRHSCTPRLRNTSPLLPIRNEPKTSRLQTPILHGIDDCLECGSA